MTPYEELKNKIVERVPEIDITPEEKVSKEEASEFLKENPIQEKYMIKNLRRFMNGEMPDDNSVELYSEWDEMYRIAHKKSDKEYRSITLEDVLRAWGVKIENSDKKKYSTDDVARLVYEKWQLGKPLKDQSEETLEFINSIL